MRASDLPARIMNTIADGGLIPPGSSVLVACSGGPDSVALLDVLHTLDRRRRQGWHLAVAHINHMLRGAESEADARFVHELAARYGLPFILGAKRVKAVVRSRGISIEEAAREVRYEFFAEAAEETGATVVATGHTADDNAETILHHILRGTGLRGLAGIPIKRPLSPGSSTLIVRPVLLVSRADLRKYLAWRGLVFRMDSSNLDLTYLRNRIRQELIPYLEREYSPGVRQALLRLGDIAGSAEDLLMDLVTAKGRKRRPVETVLSVARLSSMPQALRQMVIRDLISSVGVAPSHRHIADVARLLTGASGQASVSLPGGLRAERTYGSLRFVPSPARGPRPTRLRKSLAIPGEVLIADVGRVVRAEPVASRPAKKKHRSCYEEIIDLDTVKPPLVVRRWRRGDRFQPLGMTGKKKLSDYFIDRKVPRAERDLVPLVADKAGIIWIVGRAVDERVKLTPKSSRFLRLSALPASRTDPA